MERTKRILVVDDEPFFCDMLEFYLLKTLFSFPLSLVSVANGQEALEALQRQSFDLLITDYQMPVMNGIQLIEAVEQLPPSLHPKHIVLISGDCPSFDSGLSVTTLDKPVNFEKLKSTLRLSLADDDSAVSAS